MKKKTLAAACTAAVVSTGLFAGAPAMANPGQQTSVTSDGRYVHVDSPQLVAYGLGLQKMYEETSDPEAWVEGNVQVSDEVEKVIEGHLAQDRTGLEVSGIELDLDADDVVWPELDEALAGETEHLSMTTDLGAGRISLDAQEFVDSSDDYGDDLVDMVYDAVPDHHDYLPLVWDSLDSADITVTVARQGIDVATVTFGTTGDLGDLAEAAYQAVQGQLPTELLTPDLTVETDYLDSARPADRKALERVSAGDWREAGRLAGYAFALDLVSEVNTVTDPLDALMWQVINGVPEAIIDSGYLDESDEPSAPETPGVVLTDVDEDHTFYAPITWLVAEGITQGYADRTFKSTRHLTRGEAASFLYRYTDPEFTVPADNPFEDVSASSSHHPAIAWMHSEQMSEGYTDNTFRKDRQITRGEVAKLLFEMADPDFTVPAQQPFEDVDPQDAFYRHTAWLKDEGLADGYADDEYKTDRNITRGELAKMLYQYDQQVAE